MIKTLLLSLLLCTSIFAKNYKEFAKEMNYEIDYQTAIQKAKKDNKQVMLFMGANFCPWCLKFEKKVLTKEKINAQLHKKYIPLILNQEEGNFPKKYKTPITPTMYFIDAKSEKILDKVIGYNNRDSFIGIVEK